MNLLTQAIPGFAKCLSFVQTRFRKTDGETSQKAAKAALSGKSVTERKLIREAVKKYPGGLTAKEVACVTGIDYIEVQRRISETGLKKTCATRGGCFVWVAV